MVIEHQPLMHHFVVTGFLFVCVCCGRHGNVKLLTDEPAVAVKVTLFVNECVCVRACIKCMHFLIVVCVRINSTLP